MHGTWGIFTCGGNNDGNAGHTSLALTFCSQKPVLNTHNCTGTLIFFSQVIHNATAKSAVTSPVVGFILILLAISNLVMTCHGENGIVDTT